MGKRVRQFISSNTRVIFAALFVVVIVLGVWLYNARQSAPQAEAAWPPAQRASGSASSINPGLRPIGSYGPEG